mmetsp:Transcript_39465/g.85145  ORF Transcript_39465/g.85145 Transcript_39465/m.85145 type:complete len:383 (+) Transcript_39465:80-1228(+)
MAPGAWSGFRRSSERTRRQAAHFRVGWSWLCPLLFPALAFCGSLRPVSLWRLPEPDQHDSRLELEATAAPIARKKAGSALTKRVPPPSVKVTKLKKGERYRGYINPKLKALVEASEYRKVVDLLARLEKEGQLDRLLVSAEGYWKDLNIFEFSALEKEEGRRAVSKILRRDWSRIWPKQLEAERIEAFELFSAFWRRVEQSQIIDTLVGEVIPDLKRGYDTAGANREDQQRLLEMSQEVRVQEFQDRFNSSVQADMYRILCENDTAIPVLSEKLLPFFARGLNSFEDKVANTPMAMPGFADISVAVTISIAFVLVLALSGALKLPSLDESVELDRTVERAPVAEMVSAPPPTPKPFAEQARPPPVAADPAPADDDDAKFVTP